MFVNLASSLLNWSYQNTKACTVLVGENSDGFPVSKTTTSETNLSTSSRPRPSSSGGNARKRRDLNVTPHAFVLFSNISNTSSSTMMESTAAPLLHDSTVVSSTELSLASDVNNATITNIVSNYTTTSIEDFETSGSSSLAETPTTKVSTSNPDQTTPKSIEDTSKTIVQEIEEILNAKIDYDQAFGPDYDDDDDSTENSTDDVVKVEELREMKPSDMDNPESIQHDYPVYSYGQEEIEIVNLNHKTISTTAKSKAIYEHEDVPVVKEFISSEELTDSNLAAQDFDIADVINVKSDIPVLQTHDINNTNLETNKSSKISVIEVPKVFDSLTPSKRILVNVTIATEPDSPNSPQSVYVLSVSLPTENAPSSPNINVNSQSEKRYIHESAKNDIEDSKSYGGGECECSCPCLDPETSSTIQNVTDFTTETTIFEETTTEEMLTTTQCPEITTSVPPTPTILILEGMRCWFEHLNSD